MSDEWQSISQKFKRLFTWIYSQENICLLQMEIMKPTKLQQCKIQKVADLQILLLTGHLPPLLVHLWAISLPFSEQCYFEKRESLSVSSYSKPRGCSECVSGMEPSSETWQEFSGVRNMLSFTLCRNLLSSYHSLNKIVFQ